MPCRIWLGSVALGPIKTLKRLKKMEAEIAKGLEELEAMLG
ncbi:MAG: hypothetical protein ACC645_11195 [Pirellulales bacterium]